MYDDWLSKKRWEQEVKEWTLIFNQTKGNKQEFQKTYQDYLKSAVWADKRKQALSRADYRCESRGAMFVNNSSLDVHHLTYERVGGEEELSDLEILCYPCHHNADKKRDRQTNERRKNSYYWSRVYCLASKKYGDDWSFDHNEEEVELEFISYLYKRHCEQSGFDFDPYFDPETDLHFLEYWDAVLNGDDQ